MDQRQPQEKARAKSGRHERNCKVCSHPQKSEIERDYVMWKSPAKIAKEYHITNRASVYRHAEALGLSTKRAQNIRAALEKFIEQADDVKVSAGVVIQAIALYARINTQGQLVDRSQQVTWNDVFYSMTEEECTAYAEHGTLPDRIRQALAATDLNGHKVRKNGQAVENKG